MNKTTTRLRARAISISLDLAELQLRISVRLREIWVESFVFCSQPPSIPAWPVGLILGELIVATAALRLLCYFGFHMSGKHQRWSRKSSVSRRFQNHDSENRYQHRGEHRSHKGASNPKIADGTTEPAGSPFRSVAESIVGSTTNKSTDTENFHDNIWPH